MSYTVYLLCSLLLVGSSFSLRVDGEESAAEGDQSDGRIVVENFDAYESGDIPTGWRYLSGRSLEPVTDAIMSETEYFVIKREGDRKFVQVYTEGEAARIILPNEKGSFRWDIRTHPRLRWDWRVQEAPANAREDRDELNDTPAAVYVTFSINFFGIPQSIKYTYSSTLPVGTVVSFRGLKVLVVASGKNGFDKWMSIERDVASDYRELYGGSPPREPLSIALWSDSDTIGGVTRADFDALELLPSK